MAGEFPNQPRTLRGAFVEFGLSIPPLFVVFQFNPVQIRRNRRLSISVPSERWNTPRSESLHQTQSDLLEIQKLQQVNVNEETIDFELRLDATDKLNDGDFITEQFGIAPQLSTLELMVHPKSESLLGAAVDALLGLDEGGFSFTKKANPPLVLFIWGHKRVLPVSPLLDPIRATVNVSLTVIEGSNVPYLYTKAVKEATSVLNLANIADIANVVVPG
jgi:hypothetical protein